MPPHPELNAAIPYTSSINKLLDDVEKELLVLIDQQPEEEKRILKINISSSPAILEFERILGSKGCIRSCNSINITCKTNKFQIRDLPRLVRSI